MPVKSLLVRLVAGVLAVAALVFPGFGIPDLLVTWDPAWQVVLEAGWGLFMTILVAAALLTVVVAPGRAAPALVQLWVAAGCVLVAAALGTDAHAALLGLGLVACGTMVSLSRAVRPWLPREVRLDVPLLAVAAVGAVPWLRYAAGEASADRQRLDGADITVGVDHHAVQAALAIAFVVLPLLAATWEAGRRYLTTCVAVASAYLGLVALAHPVTPAAIGPVWSALAMAWPIALLVAGWTARGRAAVEAPDPA